MSGTFEQLDVPPTLISFAVAVGNMKRATSPEFKGAGHRVALVAPRCYDAEGIAPAAEDALAAMDAVQELIGSGAALAMHLLDAASVMYNQMGTLAQSNIVLPDSAPSS